MTLKKKQLQNFKEYESRKIKTVGELIKHLEKLPKDTKLVSTDADLGGYDISSANYLVLGYSEEHKCVGFGHLEYECYEAYQRGNITDKQYEELIEEKD